MINKRFELQSGCPERGALRNPLSRYSQLNIFFPTSNYQLFLIVDNFCHSFAKGYNNLVLL